MAEYIEREAAIGSLLGWAAQLTETYGKNDEYVKCLESAAYNIEQIPAAEVRPVKRGEWIWDDEGYHCSECFYHAYGETGEVLSGHWHYCPHCGSDMRIFSTNCKNTATTGEDRERGKN